MSRFRLLPHLDMCATVDVSILSIVALLTRTAAGLEDTTRFAVVSLKNWQEQITRSLPAFGCRLGHTFPFIE